MQSIDMYSNNYLPLKGEKKMKRFNSDQLEVAIIQLEEFGKASNVFLNNISQDIKKCNEIMAQYTITDEIEYECVIEGNKYTLNYFNKVIHCKSLLGSEFGPLSQMPYQIRCKLAAQLPDFIRYIISTLNKTFIEIRQD